ncbi:uncharacterized protein LOC111808949 [Cucurbita pepo subsp. pepo]|uniref:uncharacterized protein LOC111808949 n=1 Tax=Cucurbita pepo subsp. pepo TaxID=3664 RepID=UPI000C9D9CEF|nr:uncharacterized protein LOC111808949 [Cucurbita pepo subsp. pepo]
MALITSPPPQALTLGSQPFRTFAYTSIPKRPSYLFQQKKLRKTSYTLATNVKPRFVLSCLKDGSGCSLDSCSKSPSEMVRKLYECINEKKLKELSSYMSEDCLIEDSLFDEPFIGKEAALKFFEELTQSMGRDVKFRFRNVYESGTSRAGATWHLVWKNTKIPFTKGCTFIDINNEQRTIQKAQIIIEPQVKAGHLILGMMKLVTSLLAQYPAIHKWVMKLSHQRWVRWLAKICVVLYKFFLHSLLRSYLTFIHCGSLMFVFTLKLLRWVIGFFN